MKIVIYNIGYSTGLKGSLKEYFLKFWRYLWSSAQTLKGIIDFFKRQNADIICLLETDVGSIRNGFKSQVKTIADKLFMPFYHHALKYGPKSWVRYLPTLRKQHDAVLSHVKGNVKRHYLNIGTLLVV